MAGTGEAAYGQHYADWKDWGAAGFGEADASTRAYFDGELRRAGLLPLAGKRVLEIGFGNGGGTLIARFPHGDSPLSLAIQNGGPTHTTYLSSERIRFLLRQAGLEPSYVRPPAPVLNNRNCKRRLLEWGQLLPRKAIERAVKLLFFSSHQIHFFSSNLALNAAASPLSGIGSES